MLTRRCCVLGGLIAMTLIAGITPTSADDGAGHDKWSIFAEADEANETGGDDVGGGGGTDPSSTSSSSSGGDPCADDSGGIGLAVDGLGQHGNCGIAPAIDVGDPGVPPVVDARGLAERAVDRLQLATADIHLSPGPPDPTYPTIPTWVWVPRDQWQTLTLSVTAGTTTVYVEARPIRMDLDSGERSTMKYSSTSIDSSFVCWDPGRAWRPGMGEDATTCSYTYATTSLGSDTGDDRYHVSGQIIYDASWTCVGQCSEPGGSLGEVPGMAGEQPVEVVERQSVVTR